MTDAAVRGRTYPSGRGYARVPGAASYDGNAARVLEREEALRERPQVRSREREQALVRPRMQVREAGKVSVFAVTGFMAVALFAALVLLSCVKLAAVSDQVVSLKSELSTLQGEEAKLRAKYELAFDLTAIDREMTASGAMAKPQSNQIVYLDLSEQDNVVLFREEGPIRGFDGMLAGVKKILGSVGEYFR